MNAPTLETSVPGLGDIYEYAFHYTQEQKNIKAGLGGKKLLSMRDLAYARNTEYKNSSIMKESFARETFLVDIRKDDINFILRNPIIFDHPEYLHTEYPRSRNITNIFDLRDEFNPDTYLESIGKDNYLVLKDVSPIPTNRLGDDERTVFMYQDQAKSYGELLKYGFGQNIFQIGVNLFKSSDIIRSISSRHVEQLYVPGVDNSSQGVGFRTGIHANNTYRIHCIEYEKNLKKGHTKPGLHELLQYSRNFIPAIAWDTFEKGLKEKYGR